MKYKIVCRKINESDLSTSSPLLPDEDMFDTHFLAFSEDVRTAAGILSVEIVEANSLNVMVDGHDCDSLKQELQPIFSQYFHLLRFSSISPIMGTPA